MAGAEARAVWQRAVNRCFVQEDAKRAPKLTYHQSSSSSSSPSNQVESESSLAVDPQDHSSAGFMPRHRNPNFPHMLPHSRSWWDHIQTGYVKPLESEVNVTEDDKKSLNPENIQELIETKESDGLIGLDHHLLGYESSEKKLKDQSFDPSSPWNLSGDDDKAGPWWRTTDSDELASLVAQRSLDFVENCDLPTPQKMMKHTYCFNSDGFQDHRSHKEPTQTQEAHTCLSKAELLEALRRSQTRAREAENMAKEANAEKEHLVKLLFKQASELFGYKQWFQLLQLKVLYFQIKNKKLNNSEIPQVWNTNKARKTGKRSRKKGKEDSKNAAKYAVSLALGLSLVGAGLLLGWTVGWIEILSF